MIQKDFVRSQILAVRWPPEARKEV